MQFAPETPSSMLFRRRGRPAAAGVAWRRPGCRLEKQKIAMSKALVWRVLVCIGAVALVSALLSTSCTGKSLKGAAVNGSIYTTIKNRLRGRQSRW